MYLISGYNPACKMPFILLGYLTLHPKSVKHTTAIGTLYLEDNFVAVVCEVMFYSILIDATGMVFKTT